MTDKKIKFSIVLPAYNVEQYIIEALECLGGQDYPEYEVIVVDDCATDATGELAEQFAAESGGGKFSVIHRPQNRGVSEARNSGMDAATGEYILFLDPDDYPDVDFVESLVDEAKRSNADITMCGFRRFDDETSKTLCIEMVNNPVEPVDDIANFDTLAYMNTCVWDKLYKRGLVEGRRFGSVKRICLLYTSELLERLQGRHVAHRP